MLKRIELSNPKSCLNRAADDEMIFVLRGCDVTTPKTIRFWISERIKAGKNKPTDVQIIEADSIALVIERGLKDAGKL
jgi:hypothetical protein